MNHLLQTLESSVSQPQPSSGTSIGSTLLQLVESSAEKRELSEEFKSHQYLLLYDVTYVIIHYVFVYYGK